MQASLRPVSLFGVASPKYVTTSFTTVSTSPRRRYYSTKDNPELNIKPNWVPFGKARYGNNELHPPVLENQYTGNAFLQSFIKRSVPPEIFSEIDADLRHFGHRVATDIHKLALECEFNKPYLRQTSQAWGRPMGSELVVTDAWNRQKDVSAEEGLIALGYNRKRYGQWARIYQYAKLYLYGPSSGLYSCPLAMTDGAAKTLEELHLLENPLFENAYQRLTSRDPATFWTSGQWMTEKGGGSDVAGGTETVAVPVDQQRHRLYGYKWFSSATDANMALTLARVADDEGNVIGGTNGITLFYIPVKENGGPIREQINLVRLKDKLGTRQLPTAELLLDGAEAYKISTEGRGIASISHMLQITRIHNATSCAGYIQRAYSLARDYAHRRRAFGRKIIDLPLHTQTLARIDQVSKAAFTFAFENVRLLGLIENDAASEEERLLFRLLNPLGKLYNAKVAIGAISECLEAIGGQAIMEDTGIPYLYRDAQIFAIWEGTTSVLAMDVLRSIVKTNGETVFAFRSHIKKRLAEALQHSRLGDAAKKVLAATEEMLAVGQGQPTVVEAGARDFALSLSNLFIGAVLLQNAAIGTTATTSNEPVYRHAELLALRFVLGQDLAPFLTHVRLDDYRHSQANYELVTENYVQDEHQL